MFGNKILTQIKIIYTLKVSNMNPGILYVSTYQI